MRLLFGLLSYLVAAVAIISGAAALLFSTVEPAVRTMQPQQEAPKVAPRVQAWLDRNAEGLVYAEKERAADVAGKERAEALRIRIPSTAEHAAMARARANGEKQAVERESATRTKESARREARRPSRQLEQVEAQTAYGYTPEPRRSSGPVLHAPE
jgi:hypothetical protein